MTIQDVTRNLDVLWNTVKEIEKKGLQSGYRSFNYSQVRMIAIDEFSMPARINLKNLKN